METVFHGRRNRQEAIHTEIEALEEKEKDSHVPVLGSIYDQEPTKKRISAYVVKPNKVRFETQENEEKIVLLLRQHMITNIPWIVVSVLLFIAPLLFLFSGLVLLPFRYQVLFFVLWYLFILAFVFERFLMWYYNVYIITDERIVDVDFHSLHYKEIAQAKIDNIQDVTFVVGGFLQSVFNYGTVFIQTAGEQREFDFNDVPNPDRVAKVLNELLLEEEKEKLEGRVS